MTWRTPITCWRAAEADSIIPVEAEAVPEAIFQTTHVPLQLRQVPPRQPTGAEVRANVSEGDVLAYLVDRLGADARSTDVIPILGDAGAGKSHLVRWLRHALSRAELRDVRVIFVPKHRTSLRGVVELVLNEFPDEPGLDELRDRLLTARESDMSESELRARMRDALCVGIEHHADLTSVSDETEEQARGYLAEALPALLRDPHFAPRYLDDGNAVARLVEEKRTGRRGDQDVEDAFEFSADDVSISIDDVSSASQHARAGANALAADHQLRPNRSLRDLAVAMLNDQLPSAIREVFGIGGEDLRELFVEIRRVLRGRQDLVLLVEDFAMFQGLQSGLIDAMTLHSTQAEELCHLVTVVAVTTGYYVRHMPDTLHARASAAYVVDAQSEDAPEQFAASYLRAIRLGRHEVESRHRANESGPSSCEGCPVIDRCHEHFGSLDGEGLYPFSSTFLERASAAALPSGFNARRFLTDVLRPVLVQEHAPIEAGDYPTERVAQRFDARRHEPSGDSLVSLRREDDGERRARLALLYRPVVNEGDLPEAVHDAFQLPPLGRVVTEVDAPTAGGGGAIRGQSKKPSSSSGEIQPLPELVAAIDAWRARGTLSQEHRRQVRQLVTQAVVSRIDFNDGGFRRSSWTGTLRPRFDTSGDASSVVLDGNRGQTRGWVQIDIASTDAAAVDAIQSLAWAAARRSWRDVENGLGRAARLEVVLDGWVQDVETQLGLRAEVDALLVGAVQALEILAGLGSAGPVPKRRSERLARALSIESQPGAPEDSATARLLQRVEKDRKVLHEFVLRRLAYAQGDRGSVAALDYRLIQSVFDRANASRDAWRTAGDTADGPLAESMQRTAAAIDQLDGLAARLKDSVPDLDQLGGEMPAAIVERLVVVLGAAHVPRSRKQEIKRVADRITSAALDDVRTAQKGFASWEAASLADRAALLGGEWTDAARDVMEFMGLVEDVLRTATPSGAVLGSGQRAQAEEAWVDVLQRARSAVERLQKVTT
jgi:hypothetical protein